MGELTFNNQLTNTLCEIKAEPVLLPEVSPRARLFIGRPDYVQPGVEFLVSGLEFRKWSLGVGVSDYEFRVRGLRFRLTGLGFGV